MRKPEAQSLTSEQRLLRWGPWWSLALAGSVLGGGAMAWGLVRATREGSADTFGFLVLGGVFILGGWTAAGLVRHYRTRHGEGLDGRNAPAQLWLLGHERLAEMVATSLSSKGWERCIQTPSSTRHDHTMLHDGKRWRVRCLRQPGAASVWAIDTHWLEAQRDGLDGLVLVNLGYFSAGAEEYARLRTIQLIQGPELLALICTHPDWLAMAQAKAQWRKDTTTHTRWTETMSQREGQHDVCSLALVGLTLGTHQPRGNEDLLLLDELAQGLGWSDLEVGVRTLQLALSQACHDPRGVALAWVNLLLLQRKDLLPTALWDVAWLVEWLEEQPGSDIWEALAPHWNRLAEHLPQARQTHTRAEQEAPLLVLWKMWSGQEKHLPTTRARLAIMERAEKLGTLRIYPAANVLVDEIDRIDQRRRASTQPQRS